jgi:hypothetical protein
LAAMIAVIGAIGLIVSLLNLRHIQWCRENEAVPVC